MAARDEDDEARAAGGRKACAVERAEPTEATDQAERGVPEPGADGDRHADRQ